jgi:LemA protein
VKATKKTPRAIISIASIDIGAHFDLTMVLWLKMLSNHEYHIIHRLRRFPWCMVVVLFIGFFSLLLAGVGMLWFYTSWNRLVSLELNVDNAWASYESDVMMKFQTLPDLHEIVKGFAKHEIAFFEQLFIARQAASGALVAKNVGDFNKAQSALAQLTPRFNALSEAYPEVKADSHFLDLSRRLVRIEERLADRREFYNSEVTIWNKAIQMIPTFIIAAVKGSQQRELIDVPDYYHQDYKIQF